MSGQLVARQAAPWPDELEELVNTVTYRPGFRFTLEHIDRGQGSSGLTLMITALVQNSLSHRDVIAVNHLFPVPPAAYNRASWMRWLLDRCLDVEHHEACEFFRIDGERVFAPHHSEGEDPYTIWMIGDAATAKKRSTDR